MELKESYKTNQPLTQLINASNYLLFQMTHKPARFMAWCDKRRKYNEKK